MLTLAALNPQQNRLAQPLRYGNQWQHIQDEFEQLQQKPDPARVNTLYQKVKQWRVSILDQLNQQKAEIYQLKKNATTDPMTGLTNRRFFDQDFNRAFAQAQRVKNPLSLMIMDMDKLKSINDRYGHEGGDLMLTLMANAVKGQFRRSERLSRIGGEEFALAMENTDNDSAAQLAQRLNQRIADAYNNGTWKQFLADKPPEALKLAETILKEQGLTASFGVATYDPTENDKHIPTPRQLFSLADTGLYLCKGAAVKNPWLGADAWQGLQGSRNRVFALKLDKAGNTEVKLAFVGRTAAERGVKGPEKKTDS
jgi:diguanylate cyclase (GGDEF)-like protein